VEIFQRLNTLDPAAVGAEELTPEERPFLRFDAEAQELFDGWRADLEPAHIKQVPGRKTDVQDCVWEYVKRQHVPHVLVTTSDGVLIGLLRPQASSAPCSEGGFASRRRSEASVMYERSDATRCNMPRSGEQLTAHSPQMDPTSLV